MRNLWVTQEYREIINNEENYWLAHNGEVEIVMFEIVEVLRT